MSAKQTAHEDESELRRKAETMLGRMIVKTVPSLAPESVEALVHELRVHQIELQVQCEELRRTRQEAEESRDRYLDLYESAPVAYLTLDRQGIEQANKAAERLLDVDRTLLLGKPLAGYVAEEDAPRFMQLCRDAVESPGRRSCEMALQGHGGGVKTVLIDACSVGVDPQHAQLRLAMTDITERKQAEDRLKRQELELQENRTDLRALNARLLSLEEDLRQRVARDLQEEYSQRVTALMWKLAEVERQDGLDPRVMYKVQDIQRHLSHLSVDLYHLAHRLHSRFLEHCDLHEAMKEYIDELNMYARPQVEFEAAKGPAACRPEQAVALFRVLQEALTNVSQHAEAKSVAVSLHSTEDELALTIRDTGKGFDPQHRAGASAGFGLIIMRERMRAVGGRFAIESGPGRGTTVKAWVPISAA